MTFADHLRQNAFVRLNLKLHHDPHKGLDLIQEIGNEFRVSEKLFILIPFSYRDQVAKSLGYRPRDTFDYTYFDLAPQLKLGDDENSRIKA